MNPVRASELVFEVTEEAEGGHSAECLTENIFTQGETWQELRANVKEATKAYFCDGPKPKSIRLHLVRDEVLAMG
jgi:predicted RNase H-like HicB family nuclease